MLAATGYFNAESASDSAFIGELSLGGDVRPVNGVRDFAGVLKAYEDQKITVETDQGETMTFAKKDISFVKLDDFDINDFNK